MDLKYNERGRLEYNPEFHPNNGKKFNESDLEYLCKYYEIDGPRMMSYALGRTEASVVEKVVKLKKEGLFDYYKNKPDNAECNSMKKIRNIGPVITSTVYWEGSL